MSFKRGARLVCGYEVIIYPEHLFREFIPIRCEDYQCRDLILDYTIIEPPKSVIDDNGNVLDVKKVYNVLDEICLEFCETWARNNSGDFLNYAFNLHNLDINENGDYKKHHFHLYVWTDTPDKYPMNDLFKGILESRLCGHIVSSDTKLVTKRKKTYETKILCSCNSTVNPIKSLNAALRYLVHIDNRDKAQYRLQDCQSNIDLVKHPAFRQDYLENELIEIYKDMCRGLIGSYAELFDYCLFNRKLDVLKKYDNQLTKWFNSTGKFYDNGFLLRKLENPFLQDSREGSE